jgi:hypothetical protein
MKARHTPLVSARVAAASFAFAITTGAVSFGCSSSSQDPGPGANNNQNVGAATNPYGVAYPTEAIGAGARRGTIAGDVLRNYKFLGYRNTEQKQKTAAGELESISMSEFFDPEGRQYKLIHINVGAVWCEPCNAEAEELRVIAPEMRDQGVLFIQALSDGPVRGVGATQKDLDGWMTKQQPTFTELLDPEVVNLGPLFVSGAVPFNADIDPRTMEILKAQAGYNGNLKPEVQRWLDWVNSNAPSYGGK